MGIKIYQVDSFTNQPFNGNPAGVCVLSGPVDEIWAQQLAGEMNLSETAFLVKEGENYNLRWFTPTVEVDLCGHATLASAHILWEQNYLGEDQEARFMTRSGLLKARRVEGWIRLDFPAKLMQEQKPPEGLLQALGVEAKAVSAHQTDFIIEVESEESVKNLQPDFDHLRKLPVRDIIVTSVSSDPGDDFVSRVFVPAVGIDEDPVTGSAHCYLGPYWKNKLGKDFLFARQISRRGGQLKVEVLGERVNIFGQAVTVFTGELRD